MIDRIKSLMDYYHLSPAQFADKIGFQRSALSHVLSGRNKASLDFVLKVKNSFPNLNLEWLTLGEGNQFINTEGRQEEPEEAMVQIDFDSTTDSVEELEDPKVEQGNNLEKEKTFKEIENSEREITKSQVNQQFNADKAIKRIILLYDDGSFSEHIPEK